MSLVTVSFIDGNNIRIRADNFYQKLGHYWRVVDGKHEMMYDIAHVSAYKIKGKWNKIRRCREAAQS